MVCFTVRWTIVVVNCRDPAVDVAALKGNGGNVLIGTPGRLDDVMKRCPFLEFKSLEVTRRGFMGFGVGL